MKEMKTTAQVLVDCLEAEGVDVMFGIPGEETLDLMFAIRDTQNPIGKLYFLLYNFR